MRVPAAVPSVRQRANSLSCEVEGGAVNRTSPSPPGANGAGGAPRRSGKRGCVPSGVPSLVQKVQSQPSSDGGTAGGASRKRSLPEKAILLGTEDPPAGSVSPGKVPAAVPS